MRLASALSVASDTSSALAEGIGRLGDELGSDVDLLLAFASAEHTVSWDAILREVELSFPNALLVGCSAGGVLASGHEAEGGPGLALLGARLPGVAVQPVRLDGHGPEEPAPDLATPALTAARPKGLILIADPFSCGVEQVVAGGDRDLPGSVKVGGLASAGRAAGQNVLALGDAIYTDGLVGVALSGAVRIDAVVAQGCKPIGSPLFVTRAERNVVLELDQRPALEVIREIYENASPEDRALFQGSLFLGIQMREQDGAFRRGDFLVRNLIGSDPDSGAVGVAAEVREGTVVQLQLRDARTSAEDLDTRLGEYTLGLGDAAPPAGALLFSCLGRGQGLYGVPHHDSRLVKQRLGDLPVSGFFGNGEIGPVQGQTFLHAYTSSLALLRPA